VLHRGEIVERGNHDALMELRGRYYKMYQLQKGETAPVGQQGNLVSNAGTVL
jgi:ATP-binding cassette subfamily B protein